MCFMRNPYGPPHDAPAYAEVTTATGQVIHLCEGHLNWYLDGTDEYGSWAMKYEPRKLVLLVPHDSREEIRA